MRRLIRLAIGAALICVASQAVAACPGDDWWTVEQERLQAQFVFVGTPEAEWADPGAGGWIAGTFYRLKVERIISGTPINSVDLFSENSSGRFPMRIGVPYLVFASSCDGRLYAYSRGNSGTLQRSQEVLAQVMRLESKR